MYILFSICRKSPYLSLRHQFNNLQLQSSQEQQNKDTFGSVSLSVSSESLSFSISVFAACLALPAGAP